MAFNRREVQCPNVVSVLDSYETPTKFCIVMELYDDDNFI